MSDTLGTLVIFKLDLDRVTVDLIFAKLPFDSCAKTLNILKKFLLGLDCSLSAHIVELRKQSFKEVKDENGKENGKDDVAKNKSKR